MEANSTELSVFELGGNGFYEVWIVSKNIFKCSAGLRRLSGSAKRSVGLWLLNHPIRSQQTGLHHPMEEEY